MRPATGADAAVVATIWHRGWREGHEGHVSEELVSARTEESFRLRASQRVADTTVATVGGTVAGFIMVVGDEVEQVYVARAHRGTGVAAALLATSEQIVADNGHESAWLAVVASNARARRFYERNGWSDCGLIDYPAAAAGGPISIPAHRYEKRVTNGLRFGLFPLGLAGGPDGVASGPPDDFSEIAEAVMHLQGDGPPLLVRMYAPWTGSSSTAGALAQVGQLVDSAPISWDLVLVYRDRAGNVPAWMRFVAGAVEEYGGRLAAIQVTGEANLTTVPDAADGAFPNAAEAFVHGLITAAEAKRRSAATAAIGFAVSPEVNPAEGFWPAVAELAGGRLAGSVDYAGLDMYPDVFGPRFELDQLDAAVDFLLRSFREQALPRAAIGADVPIRICESGWPTSAGRSEDRQADVLETVLRAVHARAGELNVTHWELFTLRDADSSKDDLFHNFGILRDDYSAKPAYDRLARLFTELR